jgi:hypothetical protein
MNLSGLTSVNTVSDMLTWLAGNCLTPIRPVMTGTDFGIIMQKLITVLNTGGGSFQPLEDQRLSSTNDVVFHSLNIHSSGPALLSVDDRLFVRSVGDGTFYLFPEGSGGGIAFRNFADDQTNTYFGDNGNMTITGSFTGGQENLGGVDLSGFPGTSVNGKVLIGWNRSGSQGETDFINTGGTASSAIGGFRFITIDNSNTETAMLDLNGTTFAATFMGAIVPGVVQASSVPATILLTLDADTGAIASRTAAEVASDIGIAAALLLFTPQTSNYTLALTDTAVAMNSASANTLTVPPNSAVAFPVGAQVILTNKGAGQTTVAAGSGVTVNSPGGALKLRVQHSSATLVKTATDEWLLMGDII